MMDSKCLTITLVSTFPDSSKRVLKLGPGQYRAVVGRSSKVESKRLHPAQDNGWFDNRVMSRSHAEFSAIPKFQEVYLMDTNSMHGTWVNGVRLTSGRKTLLEPNDILTFGAVVSRGIESYDPVKLRLEITWKEDKNPMAATPYNAPHRQPNTFVVPDDDSDSEYDGDDVEVVDEMPLAKEIEQVDEVHEEEVVDIEEWGSENNDFEVQPNQEETFNKEEVDKDDEVSQSSSADANSEDSIVASSVGEEPRDPSPLTSSPHAEESDAGLYGQEVFPTKDPSPWAMNDDGYMENGRAVDDTADAARSKYPDLLGPLTPLVYQRGESSKNQDATSGEHTSAHMNEQAQKKSVLHEFPELISTICKTYPSVAKSVPPSKCQPAIHTYRRYDNNDNRSGEQKQGGYIRPSDYDDERDNGPSAMPDSTLRAPYRGVYSPNPLAWSPSHQHSHKNSPPQPSSYMQGPFTTMDNYAVAPPLPPQVSAYPPGQADKIVPPTQPAPDRSGPISSSNDISDIVKPTRSSHSCPSPSGGYSEDKYSPEPFDDRSEWLASCFDPTIERMTATNGTDEINGYGKLKPLSVSRSDPRAIVQENGDSALKRKRDAVDAGTGAGAGADAVVKEPTGLVSTSAEMEEAIEPSELRADPTERKQALENTPETAAVSSHRIDEDQERPRKRMRTAKRGGNATRYAATALAGAVVGGVGAVMALAALPAGFFD